MENVINFDLLKEYDGTLKEVLKVWQKQKSYSVDDTVQYKGNYLKCTTAGTSGTTTLDFTGLDIGDTITDGTVVWEIIEPPSGGADLPEWQPNTSYTAGKYLVHEGTVYKVDNDFTSGTTFSDTNLTAYIAPIMQGATSSADGKAGMVIKPTTTDVDKFLKGDGTWGSAGGGISIWQANTAYNINDVVIDSNLIWQCATAHTSTTTFDESKWICISGGEISNGMEIVPLWEGEFSFSNSTQGATPTSSTPMMELSEPISNFEYILVCGALDSDLINADSVIVPISAINPPGSIRFSIVLDNNDYYTASINQYDSTHLYIAWKVETYSQARITKVQGIRKAKPIVSSGMKYETLWEGEEGSISSTGSDVTINLNESLKKYKKLGFNLIAGSGGQPRYYYREMSVDELMVFIDSSESNRYIPFTWNGTGNDYFELTSTTTDVQLKANYKNNKITKIIGISEGVQIPTGVQAARVTLFQGTETMSENMSISLNDSISNYDLLEITFCDTDYTNLSTLSFDVNSIIAKNILTLFMYLTSSYWCRLTCTLSTANISGTEYRNAGNISYYVTKVVGIKYIQPDSYSTEEKLIGTWIDGKPMYQVTITGNTGSGGDIDYPTDYNIDKIISAECMLENLDGSNFRPLTYYAGGDYASIICQKTRFHLYLNGISNFTYYLTIKYIKN